MKKDKNTNIITISVAVIVASALLFYLTTFQVRKSEKAVVTTFGKPSGNPIEKPGLYWKMPYPFQDVYIFDARIRVFTTELEQTFTSDDKNVILQTFIAWKIDKPLKFLASVGTIEDAQKALEGIARDSSNSIINKYTFSNLISYKKDFIGVFFLMSNQYQNDFFSLMANTVNEEIYSSLYFNRLEEIEKEVLEAVNKKSVDNYGVVVKYFGIKKLELPEQTTNEVFNRMREERNSIAQKYRSEGDKTAKDIRVRADSEKESIIIDAKAKAKDIIGKGDKEAAEFYKIFKLNEALAIWIRKLDALEKLLDRKTTLIIDPNTAPFDMLRSSPELKQDKDLKKIVKKDVKEINKEDIQKLEKKLQDKIKQLETLVKEMQADKKAREAEEKKNNQKVIKKEDKKIEKENKTEQNADIKNTKKNIGKINTKKEIKPVDKKTESSDENTSENKTKITEQPKKEEVKTDSSKEDKKKEEAKDDSKGKD